MALFVVLLTILHWYWYCAALVAYSVSATFGGVLIVTFCKVA